MSRLIFAFSILLSSFIATAVAPTSFVVQGQIFKSNGEPLEESSVSFILQVHSTTDRCLLHEEAHTINMSGSNGIFNLSLGSGTNTLAGGMADLTTALDNSLPDQLGLTCDSGSNYDPSPGDTRRVAITFDDGSGPVTLAQDHIIESVPYAQYAGRLGGKTAAEFIQTNSGSAAVTQANLEAVFNSALDATELRNLIDGTSGNYTPRSGNGAGALPTFTTATPPTAPSAGDIWYDTTANTVVYYDGTTTQTISAGIASDPTKLPLAGGTMTGNINMDGNQILNASHITQNSQSTVTLGAFTSGQEATLIGSLNAGNAGATWYNSDTGVIRYWDGAAAHGLSTSVVGTSLASANIWVGSGTNQAAAVAVTGDISISNTGVTAIGSGVIVDADINASAAIDASKIGGGGVSTTEFNYLGSVTSDIQTQLNAKLEATDIAGKVDVGGDTMTGELIAGPVGTNPGDGGVVTFQELAASGTDKTGFKAPDNIGTAAGVIYELPTTAPTAGQVLSSNVAGVLSWTTLPTPDGSTLNSTQVWVGDATNNAVARTLTGDVTISNTGVTALGSGVIVDADVNASAGIAATKLAGGTVDNTEFGYLNGVTSAIQAQFNAKVDVAGDTMTGELIAGPVGTNPGDGGVVTFQELAASGTDKTGFKAPDNIGTAAGVIYELPTTAPTAGQVLSSNVAGVLSWTTLPTPDGSTLNSTQVWVGDATNNAVARTLTGDVTISNTGVTAIGSGVIVDADINASAAIDASKIGGGGVSTTEFNYLGSVTSDIQTQLNAKVDVAGDTMTGELIAGPVGTNPGDGGVVTFQELAASGTDKTGFKAPDNIGTAAGVIYELPTTAPTAGQLLSSSAGGVLSWADPGTPDGATLNSTQVWVGDATNNAVARTLTGDVTISNTGVTAIGSGVIVDADINASAAIAATKLAGGTVDNTEFGYLNGVTSAIQTQLNAKVDLAGDTMTGQLTIGPVGVAAGDGGVIGFQELAASGTDITGFRAPDSIGTSAGVYYALPAAAPTGNQVLQSDVSGNLTWVNQTSGADNLGNHTAGQDIDMNNFNIDNLNLGAEATPSLAFNGDPNTGMWSGGPDVLNFSTAGNEAMVINATGQVGIGAASPSGILDIEGGDVFIGTGTLTNASGSEDLSVTGNVEVDGAYYGDGSNLTGVVKDAGDTMTGELIAGPVGTNPGDGGVITFQELAASGTDKTGFKAPDNIGTAAGVIYELPTTAPTAGQILSSSVAGVLSWTDPGTPDGATLNSTQVWVGDATNNAVARTLTGDVTISNTGVTAIGSGVIVDADINASAAIAATKLAGGTVDNTEFGYLNGVTSAIQTQLNAKLEATDIAGKVDVAGDTMTGELIAGPVGTNPGDGGVITFQELAASGTDKTGFKAPDNIGTAAGVIYELPTTAPTAGQILSSSVAGVLSWTDPGTPDGATLNSTQVWVGDATNNAVARTLTGDVTISNTGVTAIGSGVIVDADINASAAIDASKIGGGGVSTTEFNYLGSVTSDIQTQLNSKVDLVGDTMTGQLTIGPVGVAAGDGGVIGFQELAASGTDITGFRAPDSIGTAAGVYYALPSAAPTGNQVLQSDVSGNLTWVTQSSGADHLGNHTAGQDLNLNNYNIDNLNLGAEATPSFSFNGDTNTGIWSGGPDVLNFSTAGNEAMVINATGQVGIGAASPSGILDIEGGDVFIGTGTLTNASGSEDLSVTGNVEVDGAYYGDGSNLTGVVKDAGDTMTGELIAGPVGTNPGDGGVITFQELAASGTDKTGFKAPDNIGTAAGVIYELPTTAPTAGQILSSSVAGVLSWTDPGTPDGATLNSTQVWVGDATNNAVARTLTGDVTISNTGVTAIGSGVIVDADINASAAIAATKLAGGTVDNTEFGYLNGVTSAIQTQLNAKLEATDIAGKVDVAGDTMTGELIAGPVGTNPGDGGVITFQELAASGTDKTGFKAPDNIGTAAGVIYELPTTAPTAGQILSSSVAGVLSWTDPGTPDGATLNSTQVWVGDATNNAVARTLTGDVTISNTGVTAIGSGVIVDADINASAAIAATKLAGGTVDNTEFGYLNGVTSAIQTQLNAKVDLAGDTMTGQLTIGPVGVAAGDGGVIGFQELAASGTDITGFRAPDSIGTAAGVYYALPAAAPTGNQVLQSDVSGNLTWVTQSSGADHLGNHTAGQDLDLNNYNIDNLNLGAEATPSLAFNGDTNTGIWSSGSDTLSISTGGNEALGINSSGNVAIGTSNYSDQLNVGGNIHLGSGTPQFTLKDIDNVNSNNAFRGKLSFQDSADAESAVVGFDSASNNLFSVMSNLNVGMTLGTNATEAIRIDNTGRVGIGHSSPVSKIHLQYEDTGTSTPAVNGAARFEHTWNPASNSSANAYAFVMRGETGASAVDYTGTLVGEASTFTHKGTGTVSAGSGTQAAAVNNTTGTITKAYGGSLWSNNASTGTIGEGYGALIRVVNGSGGDVTDAFGVKSQIVNNNASSTMTNSYEMYLATVNSGTITNQYGVYQSSSASSNYFAGNVGIGTDSPTDALVVDGAIRNLASQDNTSSSTIDFSTGNVQHTDDDCQAFTLHNMKDGGSYTLIVKGTSDATACSFTAFTGAGSGALTEHMPPGHTTPTAGTHTIYTAIVSDGDVYFSWIPGY